MSGGPRQLVVVLNPHADHGRARALAGPLGALLARSGGRLCVSEDAESLASAARTSALGERDVLGIVGGDGSVCEVLSAFAMHSRTLPHIALLRGGTMNTVANGLGIPREPSLQLVARLLERQPAMPLPVIPRGCLRVEQRLGFLFGTGVVSGFLERYNARQDSNALAAASLLSREVLMALRGDAGGASALQSLEARLRLDERSLPPTRYQLVAAATVAQMGLGFRPFHRAPQCLNRLQVLAFRGGLRRLALHLPSFYLGRPLPESLGVDTLVERLEIESPRPTTYSLDGDVHRSSGTLRVQAGPVLRLWHPHAPM